MKYIKQFIVGIALVLITAFAVTANGQARNPYMPSQGGTGTSTNPTYGQVLVGNAQGTYTLTATSSLGITGGSGSSQWTTNGSDIYYNTGNVGIGTTTPGQKLSVGGDILGNNIIGSYFTGTSTATSTIKGVVVLSPDGTYMSGAPNSPLTMYTTGYIGPWQTKIVNRSTSNFAITGMTVAGDKYVDNGFPSSYYGGMFFASSNYNVPGFNGLKPNGVAVIASDGPITIGSATSSQSCGIRYQAGGFDDNQLDGCVSGITGNWGIGASTTPYALLSVHQYSNKNNRVIFAVASSTATATTTLFQIDNTGTTTAANGFNITNGCFSINGSCVGGSGGSGTVGSGTAGQTTYYAGAGTTLTATSSVFINSSTADVFIGTTTAGATAELTVHNSATRTNIIQGYSSAGGQVYAVLNNGNTTQSGSISATSGANALTLDSNGFSMAGGSVIPRILFGAANVNSPRLARANLTSSVLLLNNGSGTQTAGGFSIGSSTPTAFVTFSTSSPATVNNWLFAIGTTTTNVSTSTSFLIDGLGQVGIGTSTNAGTLSIESNSGTTTVYVGSSAKPSCVQYYAQNGTAYRQYMSNAGTLVTQAGACK